jgi:predicted TIM-barrel fold metal-dependent hydrolase
MLGGLDVNVSEALADAAAAGVSPFNAEKMPERRARPERSVRRHLVISVDDHLVEPPNMFDGRLPEKYADRTPRVVDDGQGGQQWLFDNLVLKQIGINATVGQSRDRIMVEPVRFDEMRDGTWNIHERIADMDLDGVYASLCFPSVLGFAGVRLQGLADQEFALAVMRAWNDWHIEEWVGTYPGRMIPCQIPWLNDAELGAAEIQRNADRGFTAVTFPELPGKLGFAPLVSPYWDPFFAACEETETVVCVHTGSSGLPIMTEGTEQSVGTLFGSGYAMVTAIEWLHAGIAARFPGIKICLSEGGIGWIGAVLDRLEHQEGYRDAKPRFALGGDPDRTGLAVGDPMLKETLRRNYWFCTLDEPSGIAQRDRIGVDRIVFEVDYPHSDTAWPHTQKRVSGLLEGVPADEAAAISWRNAAQLFRHPVPAEIQLNPEAF